MKKLMQIWTLVPAVVLVCTLLAAPAAAQLAVPNENGLTFGHVHLNVTDIELHKRLWVEHFGGEVVEKGPLTLVRFPNFHLALTEKEPSGGSQGSVMNHFGFKVRSTPKFLEKWKETGLRSDPIFIGAEGHRNAYVMMPDDVWVELQEDQALPMEVFGYHVHFVTPDFLGLLDWYVDVFDLEALARGAIATATNVPGMNMSFGRADNPTVPTKGRSVDHIGFEVEDLAAYVEMLKAKGVEFDEDYREIDSLGLKVAFLTDPSGTYVELTEGLDAY